LTIGGDRAVAAGERSEAVIALVNHMLPRSLPAQGGTSPSFI
jgi:hypothetical protein